MEVSHDQIIVHLNSHGAKAMGDIKDMNNEFTNYTTTPIKNISKIGLL